MPSNIVSWALTTAARVKARLGITASDWDALLVELINAATDYIERECGQRRFLSTTYTQEVYSGGAGGEAFIILRNAPVTTLSAAQFRSGTPDNPSWTSFPASNYELVMDREPCRVRIYGGWTKGTNNLRFTYTAGYKIDFTAETDTTKHTLPFDLSDLCERLVVSAFKQREAQGKSNEAGQEASVTWRANLTSDDRAILSRYAIKAFY